MIEKIIGKGITPGRMIVLAVVVGITLIAIGYFQGIETLIAASAVVAFLTSAWVAVESWVNRQETFRPVVQFFATREEEDVLLKLSNFGQRPAYQVIVELDGPLAWYLPKREDHSVSDPDNAVDLSEVIGFLKYPTPSLAPSSTLEARVSARRDDDEDLKRTNIQRFIVPDTKPITGRVKYQNQQGKAYSDRISIDFRILQMLKLESIERTTRHPIDMSSVEAMHRSALAAGLEITTEQTEHGQVARVSTRHH